MKFNLRSDETRQVKFNMALINAYASNWVPGTVFECEIVRKQRTVSNPLRKHYFGHILPRLLDALGYDPDESMLVHRHLKIVYFHVQPDSRGIYRDKDIPSVFSNESDVPVGKKNEFIDWVIRKIAENGGDLTGVV